MQVLDQILDQVLDLDPSPLLDLVLGWAWLGPGFGLCVLQHSFCFCWPFKHFVSLWGVGGMQKGA